MVGVLVAHYLVADRHDQIGADRVVTDFRVFVGGLDHPHQISRARPIFRRQAGRIREVRIAHPDQLRLRVHRFHDGRHTARVRASEQLRGVVLRRHQRQVQRLPPGQAGARTQPRLGPAVGTILAGNFQILIERQLGVQRHHRRHQLGDRRDRGDVVGVLLVQHLVGVLIDHERHLRPQSRIVFRHRLSRPGCPRRKSQGQRPAQGPFRIKNRPHAFHKNFWFRHPP